MWKCIKSWQWFHLFCSRRAWQAFGAPQDTRQSLDHIVVGRCTTSFPLLHSHYSVPIASSNFSIWQNKGDNKHVKKTQLMWDWQKPPSIFLQEPEHLGELYFCSCFDCIPLHSMTEQKRTLYQAFPKIHQIYLYWERICNKWLTNRIYQDPEKIFC